MGKSRDEYNRQRRERLNRLKNPDTAAEAKKEMQMRKLRLEDLEPRLLELLIGTRGGQVELDDSGWAKVSDVTTLLDATHNEILSVVRKNFFEGKRQFRFSDRDGGSLVRFEKGRKKGSGGKVDSKASTAPTPLVRRAPDTNAVCKCLFS